MQPLGEAVGSRGPASGRDAAETVQKGERRETGNRFGSVFPSEDETGPLSLSQQWALRLLNVNRLQRFIYRPGKVTPSICSAVNFF